MAGNTLHLLVILLAFSHLMSLNAVPISRTINLLHDNSKDIQASEDPLQTTEEYMEEEELNSDERRELVHIDYSGTGPNDRHTPKLPPMRS